MANAPNGGVGKGGASPTCAVALIWETEHGRTRELDEFETNSRPEEWDFSHCEGAVSANLLEIRRSWTRTRFGARVFQVCFAIPATSIAVYATVLSGETNAWQTAILCWLLTGLVIWLIARIAAMIERCEREATQNEGPRVALPVKRRRAGEH